MRLTVFGATGRIGSEVVRQALAAGHEVAAVVRDPARLAVPAGPGLGVVTADVMDPAQIGPAIKGSDAVVSALGPRKGGPPAVLAAEWAARAGLVPRPWAGRAAEVPGGCWITEEGGRCPDVAAPVSW